MVIVRLTRTRVLTLVTVSAVFAAGALAFAQQGQPDGEVRVVSSPVGSGPEDTTYEIRSGSCRIRWTIARSGANQGIAQHRANCSRPLAEQIALNSRILDKVLVSEPTFRMLFLGPLTPFPELSVRLAAAAKRSPDWDARRGRPKTSTAIDTYLLMLLSSSEPAVFAEWKRLFEEKGLRFAVAGVEEASVGPAGGLPYFQQLTAHGVRVVDRLPYACLVWLSAARQR